MEHVENYETVKKVETILDFEQAKRELKAAAISSEESDRENQLRVIGNRERRKTSALGRRKTSRLRPIVGVDGGSPGGSTHKLSPKNSPKTSPSTSSVSLAERKAKSGDSPGGSPAGNSRRKTSAFRGGPSGSGGGSFPRRKTTRTPQSKALVEE